MTRRRWIADQVTGNRAALIGEHAEHLVRVLRVRIGQEFDVAAADQVRRGRVVEVTPDRVEFELGEAVQAPAAANLTLILAIFKFDRMEWAIEKCVELGISRIVPLIAGRTDKHLAQAADKRVERWRRIAREATEQSRRVAPPEMADPVEFSVVVKRPARTAIVLAESEQGTTLRNCLESLDASTPIMLAVGPEGGWTERELKSFHDNGWIPASLGQTILRAETAAIAATAIVVSQLE